MSHTSADVVVIGAGVAGLCSALALADDGLDVVLVSDVRAGEASAAAGGMLDTGHGVSAGPHQPLFRHARDLWPSFVARLVERTGITIPLNRDGILELAATIHDAERLAQRAGDEVAWLDAAALSALEPQLAHAQGALHFRHDGAVNPLLVLRALKHAASRHPHLRVETQTVAAIEPGAAGAPVTITRQGADPITAMRVVVAGGAWSPALPGVPMHLPIAPLKGQMLSVASKALRHVVMLGDGYVIPRGDGRTLLGGTEEQAGFDPRHTEEGVQAVRARAARILPSLATAPLLNAWAGHVP